MIIIIIYKTIKAAYLTDGAIPNIHNRNSTIIENLQIYTDLKVELLMVWLVKRPIKKDTVALVRERTIPTERPPPVGEVSANFCG